jgi:hypothetical protein
MPAATQALLNDAAVDIETWISSEVDVVSAEQESAAFASGDGANKPKGFLSCTALADTAWSWGNFGYVATGTAGAFKAGIKPSQSICPCGFLFRRTLDGQKITAHSFAIQAALDNYSLKLVSLVEVSSMASLLSVAAVIATVASSAVLPGTKPMLVARANNDCSEAAAEVVAKTGGQLLSVQPSGDSCVITVLVQGNGERPRKVTVKMPM